MWLINATITDQSVELAEEYIEYQKKKVSASNVTLMFGHLLIDMGEYEKAQKYFEIVLCDWSNEKEVACAYNDIGHAFRLKGEHCRALDNYQKSVDLHMTAAHPRLVCASKILNEIGVTHSEMKEYERACFYFTRALKLYEKCLPETHLDVAAALFGLGTAYLDRGENEKAMDYLKRAQKIYLSLLPYNHPNVATTLVNIGNAHYKNEQYDEATECYIKA
ncbi:unnamed protein product, partial [Didymodactylos carnosus]